MEWLGTAQKKTNTLEVLASRSDRDSPITPSPVMRPRPVPHTQNHKIGIELEIQDFVGRQQAIVRSGGGQVG